MSTGAGTALCAAAETTWGTAVTPATNCRPLSQGQMEADWNRVGVGRIASGFFAGDEIASEDASGSVTTDVTYENMGFWLQYCLWGTPSTTGSGPYTHVYNGGSTQPVGMTLHMVLGDTGNGRQMVGALVNTWSLSISVGDPVVRLSMDFIGKQVTQISAVTPSYGSGDETVMGLDAAKLSWNSNTYCIRSITISASNALERRRCLGEDTTAKPQPTGDRTFEVDIELDWDANIANEYAAHTEANASIVFTGSGNNTMTWLMRNFSIVSVDDPISGPGVMTQRVRARLRENPSGTYPFQITVVNDNSSATAN